ncbi:MAG TPA: hypothetical protein VGC89_16130 [Pyrinomonadaceae bacterium]|jgi:hypothetical protein
MKKWLWFFPQRVRSVLNRSFFIVENQGAAVVNLVCSDGKCEV